jgi:hypothetical protein
VTDPDAAERLYAEGIACTQRSGDRLVAYLLHNNTSVHALRAGDAAAAHAHLVQAGQAGAEIGELSRAVAVNPGWVLRQEHDPNAARDTFQDGLRLSRRTGDRYGLAYCSLGLACVAGDLGEWHRAAGLHGAAQAFFNQLGGPWQDPEDRYLQDSIAAVRRRLWRPAVRPGLRPRPDAELRRHHRTGSQRSPAGRRLTGPHPLLWRVRLPDAGDLGIRPDGHNGQHPADRGHALLVQAGEQPGRDLVNLKAHPTEPG